MSAEEWPYMFTVEDLLDELRKTQVFIKNEICLRQYLRFFNRVKVDTNWEAYYENCIAMKYHCTYMLIYHLIESGSVQKSLPIQYFQAALSQAAVVSQMSDCKDKELSELWTKLQDVGTTKNLLELCTVHAQNVNQSLFGLVIDVITFSIIPSLFGYFVMEYEIVPFTNFMKRVARENAELFMKLARCLFVTPCFLKFMQETVKPIFENILYSDVKRIDAPAFIEAVRARWHDMSEKVPIYVSKLFAAIGEELSIRVLRECFWERFIMSPNLFSGVNYYEFVPSEFISPLRSVLADDGVMKSLVKSLTRFQLSRNWSVITTSEYSKMKHFRVFSTIDMLVVAKMDPKNVVECLMRSIQNLKFAMDISCKEIIDQVTQTGYEEHRKMWGLIRQLLKEAPDIPPTVNSLKDVRSVDTILEELLVKRARIDTLPKQYDLWLQYTATLSNQRDIMIWRELNREDLIRDFENMLTTVGDPEMLVDQTRFDKEINTAVIMQKDVMSDARCFLAMHMCPVTEEEEVTRILTSNRPFEIRYMQFHEAMKRNFKCLATAPFIDEVIYHLYFRKTGINYSVYQLYRPEYRVTDRILERKFKQVLASVDRMSELTVATTELCNNVLRYWKDYEDIKNKLQILMQCNGTPMTKMLEIVKCCQQIEEIASCRMNVDNKNRLPLQMVVLACANPSKLYTFMAYLSEFLIKPQKIYHILDWRDSNRAIESMWNRLEQTLLSECPQLPHKLAYRIYMKGDEAMVSGLIQHFVGLHDLNWRGSAHEVYLTIDDVLFCVTLEEDNSWPVRSGLGVLFGTENNDRRFEIHCHLGDVPPKKLPKGILVCSNKCYETIKKAKARRGPVMDSQLGDVMQALDGTSVSCAHVPDVHDIVAVAEAVKGKLSRFKWY